jgi:hypothetical protein
MTVLTGATEGCGRTTVVVGAAMAGATARSERVVAMRALEMNFME